MDRADAWCLSIAPGVLSQSGHEAMVAALIAAGANVNKVMYNYASPLLIATDP